jgi:ribosomal protein S18 acetylase RimI-like enzyme
MSAQAMHDAEVIAVRQAQTGDEAALSLLGAATFLESYAHLLPVTDITGHVGRQHAPEVYARWLKDPSCRCWLAEHLPGRAPVGYAVVTPPDLPLSDLAPGDLEIRRIYLLHRFQRGGLGRRLMDEVIAHARRTGCPRVLLGVYSRNEAALAFYARLGFTRAGTRQFRVGANDYFDYILQLVL